MSAAKKFELVERREPERLPDHQIAVRGDSRAIAVAMFRELADRLECGELDGASVQWRSPSWLESETGEPAKLAVVTLTPQVDEQYHTGTVQLTVSTIEED